MIPLEKIAPYPFIQPGRKVSVSHDGCKIDGAVIESGADVNGYFKVRHGSESMHVHLNNIQLT